MFFEGKASSGGFGVLHQLRTGEPGIPDLAEARQPLPQT